MRFVPMKSTVQQGVMTLHRLREGFKEERTACINRIRGLLTEFGFVFPQSPQALRLALPTRSKMPATSCQGSLDWRCNGRSCMARTGVHRRGATSGSFPMSRATPRPSASKLYGIGPIGASALVASVGEFKQFKSGAQFASWLGRAASELQWRQGQPRSHHQTQRRLPAHPLIQGARSAVMSAHKRTDRISQWLVQFLARVGWQKAAVALANKNARILWAVLTKDVRFNADHVSGET